MNLLFVKKNKKQNQIYLASFALPALLIFPLLASYSSFFVNKYHKAENIARTKAVSLDEEIIGIEDAAKVTDLRQIDNLVKDKNSTSTNSSNKKEVIDILNPKSNVKILMLGYHQIRETKLSDGPKTRLFITSPEIFDKEMKYLYDNGYHAISTTDYINYLKNGDANFNLNKSFILTFDDGYESQYTNALPIIKKYGFTATFFIYSDCIDKYPVCLTSKELKDIAADGMKIGNHTLHHAFLPKFSDDTIKNEIGTNKQKLIDMVGTSSIENVFAYPYGATDERVEDIVRSFGYDGAVGVMATKRGEDKDLFNLRRYLMGGDYDYFEILFNNNSSKNKTN